MRRWATEGGRRGRETSGEGSDVPIREAQAMLLRPLLQFTLKRDNARCDHSELQAPTPPSLHSAHQRSVGEHFPSRAHASCTRFLLHFVTPGDHLPSAPPCTKLKEEETEAGDGERRGAFLPASFSQWPPWFGVEIDLPLSRVRVV